MVLLKLILFVYAAYFILKTAARLLPFLFNSVQQKMSDQSRSQFQNKREGEITIEHKGTGKKAYDKKIGDYIDYEEIKD